MKKIAILLLFIISILPTLAQETTSNTNPKNNTRQGFGTHSSFDAGLGFVNPKFKTDGSAYFFEDWNTEGVIYTKKNGSFKIKKVNINLYDNKLEAIYDENSVFTFDSNNLMKIVINKKAFRIFEIDGELKIFEQIFRNGFSVYKHYSVLYSEASVNPMLNRSTNKYIKKELYYLYRENKLTKMKLSKKSFSRLFESDKVNSKSIVEYIEKSKLSLKKENDLIKILNFIIR
ncbi:hypothetical protein [Dokdonia sp.]|uniref:hypothetical protein n=1 Tax=Dokdonia sp. TaxID=2024995 RepID=UPI0032632003